MFQKKVAICFSGNARAVDFTYQNIRDNLIAPFGNNVDIYACLKEDEYVDSFFRYFNPKSYIVSVDPHIDTPKINWDKRSRGLCETYMKMLWSRKKVNELRIDSNVHYDIVVHSRLDIKYYTSLYMFKLDFMDMNKLFVPDFHLFSVVQGNGINDRWAMSNEYNMDIYFRLFDFVFEDSKRGFQTHGESVLYRYIKENNIQFQKIPFRFSRVSPSGEERDSHLAKDKSLWNPIERD